MCGINSTSENAAVVVRADGRVAGVLSWDGFHRFNAPRRKVTEDDVLARALYLEKHGHQDEAVEVLDLYLAGLNPFH